MTPDKDINIRLSKEGYQTGRRQLKLGSDDSRKLYVELKPELVDIDIVSEPEDAELLIDGKIIGSANRTIQLSARSHKIEIRKPGYVPYKTTITPRPGLSQQIKTNLKSLRQVKLESVKPVIKTAAGQTLKLFEPGHVQNGGITTGTGPPGQ